MEYIKLNEQKVGKKRYGFVPRTDRALSTNWSVYEILQKMKTKDQEGQRKAIRYWPQRLPYTLPRRETSLHLTKTIKPHSLPLGDVVHSYFHDIRQYFPWI
jgi:hypothetical protein